MIIRSSFMREEFPILEFRGVDNFLFLVVDARGAPDPDLLGLVKVGLFVFVLVSADALCFHELVFEVEE